MALHNQPRFMSAIKLREEIEQSREWDDEGSITWSFIQELIMQEQGTVTPVFDRPSHDWEGVSRDTNGSG